MKKFMAVLATAAVLGTTLGTSFKVSAYEGVKQEVSYQSVSQIDSKDVYEKIKSIKFSETFTQDDNQYVVYYYQKGCGPCNRFKGELDNFANKLNYENIYAVQMDTEENREGWYDFKQHHEKYDIEIGEVDKEGKIKYYDGESAEKYTSGNLKTESGEPIEYGIFTVNENNYQKYKERVNKNAKLNKVYAMDYTARMNIEDPAKFRVEGTPTAIVVKDGKIVKYAIGSIQIKELFNKYN